ncbi:hypothetical protein AYI69_g7671 [Smittium culicis]|uniref:Uncharacterized protein n=1 Tax=Smittium culicis TaxID=133412 RepID=A0A1R1XQD5_9FUNG|nr:hypothetical protein AYI69_g7671 [Smittium culicis]
MTIELKTDMDCIDKNVLFLLNRYLDTEDSPVVTVLVYGILHEAKKSYVYRYFTESEPDLLRSEHDVVVKVTKSDCKISAVQCKADIESFNEGISQLASITKSGYQIGFNICGEKSEVYTLDLEDEDAVPVLINTYHNPTQLHELIEYIKSI